MNILKKYKNYIERNTDIKLEKNICEDDFVLEGKNRDSIYKKDNSSKIINNHKPKYKK